MASEWQLHRKMLNFLFYFRIRAGETIGKLIESSLLDIKQVLAITVDNSIQVFMVMLLVMSRGS